MASGALEVVVDGDQATRSTSVVSNHANPTVVGGFVLGAIVLTIGGVVAFGSGALFKKRVSAMAYFDGDVGGLDVGAPVNIQGVRVGSVSGVHLDINVTTLRALVSVRIDVDPERLDFSERTDEKIGTGAHLREAIKKGLRAQLQTQSLVTGQQEV